jgi:hypothetical protein
VRTSVFELPLAVVLLSIALLGAACRRTAADGPPCAVVGGRFFAIAGEDLAAAKVDAVTNRAVHDQLPAMRDSLVHACEDGEWSRAVRTCMTEAKDRLALETCQQQLTDPQRAALAAQGRGEDSKAP